MFLDKSVKNYFKRCRTNLKFLKKLLTKNKILHYIFFKSASRGVVSAQIIMKKIVFKNCTLFVKYL